MSGNELKRKLRAAGVASDSCRWVNISPQTTLGQIIIKQGLPQGYWSVTLPRGANMKERASSVLRAEGIDPEQVQFLANPNDFSEPERAIIESGGEVDGWSKS